ncbi:hemagglutinin repeat-containing protein [Luteimonas sp. WGS1318]|uniref:hemagglutinin repeat-containing protein n=1 Tax=Luteimonas sp. WGS1318 TaxID=3366815 RepID=UPI00372CF9CC
MPERSTYAVSVRWGSLRGTTISGETVDLSAGRDMSLIAAQVAGTGDVSLMAGRDLLIGGAQETYSATHDTQTRKSGLFGSGGIGVTWGTRETRNTADIEETTHIGSLIGSSAGRVDIVAGGDVAIVGSDVLSKAGIGISGENVAIVAADSTMTVEERQTMRQSGLNISLSGGVIDTAMAVYGAARRASEVDDDRLAALYAAKAGQTFAGAGNMATDASSQFAALGNTNQETAGGGGSSGINLRIGYGASSSTSTSELAQNTHTGSRIGSEGDVSIVARSGDLAVVGSTIDGDNIALVAANDILLRSSQDVSTHTSRSESQSGEVGITIGTEAGIGVYVAAAMAKGRGDGSGLVHNETVVTAANGLTFVSGNDTTLQGAQLIGETVTGRVGGNFTLISEQDADTFDRKDTSISGSAAIGAGGGSANIAFSQSKVNSEYLSVREQTGVQAGSGGFDIEVGGHTQLDGAALASASTNNRLSTGTLGWSDLENRAEYKASSISFSAGTSGNDKGSSGSFSPGLSLPQSDSASSTTRAGVAVGTIEVRDGAVDLSGLNRDVTALQQEGLKTIFDERKVAERIEMGQVAGEVGFRAAGDIADRMGWEEGGRERALLHGMTGAAVAALGGGDVLQGLAGAAASQLATVKMQEYLDANGIHPDSPEGKTLMELGSLAVGAAIGGGAGAATALMGEQFNRQLHPNEKMLIERNAEEFARLLANGEDPTPEQVQEATLRLMSQSLKQIDSSWAVRLVDDPQATAFLTQVAWNNPGLATGGGMLFDARNTTSYGQHWVNSQFLPATRGLYDMLGPLPGIISGVRGSYVALSDAGHDRGLGAGGQTALAGIFAAARNLSSTAFNPSENNAVISATLGAAGNSLPADGRVTPEVEAALSWAVSKARFEGLPMDGGSVGFSGLRPARIVSGVTGNSTHHAATGVSPVPLGLGSTGRTTPANLKEKLAMDQVRSNVENGRPLPVPMTDPRWPGSEGWVKWSQNVNGVEIHYLRNSNTGRVDDLKFK